MYIDRDYALKNMIQISVVKNMEYRAYNKTNIGYV